MVYPTLTPTRKKMKHKHADLMLAYAQDAQETDKPWERWECRWDVESSQPWRKLQEHPTWNERAEYRRKPRTIRIGNYDVPEPLRVAPEISTAVYYTASFGLDSGCEEYSYNGGNFDKRVLERGMMHLTREAAELHAKALISLTEQ